MEVYRLHLKTGTKATYSSVLDFCKNNEIIGVGWPEVTTRDYNQITEECRKFYPKSKGAVGAVRAISRLAYGDFIWTREGGKDTNYYLCRVIEEESWKNSKPGNDHIKYDVTNYVKCKWIKIGLQDCVPGNIINSFRSPRAIQRVSAANQITSIIWNKYCEPSDRCDIKDTDLDFWKLINNEDLECLVLLYLQWRGCYVYSSTIKKDTKTFEAVLVSKDGKRKYCPQVKQDERLIPADYIKGLGENEYVVLFSSSENYGPGVERVECLKRKELEDFMRNNYVILPQSIKTLINDYKVYLGE